MVKGARTLEADPRVKLCRLAQRKDARLRLSSVATAQDEVRDDANEDTKGLKKEKEGSKLGRADFG